MSSLKEKLQSLPAKPGVYLFKDKQQVVIYVGKAKILRQRVVSYFHKTQDIKTTLLLEKVVDIDYIITRSELDALILEKDLIDKYKPRYNIALRDDKAYPYLKLTTNEEWPRLVIARRKINDGAQYFGRFQGQMVREVIRQVKKLFPIRWCRETPMKMREQPCLYYRLGACQGPCIGKVSRQDYQELVKGIAAFLNGDMEQAMGQLKTEMAKAAQKQDFELAAMFRDKIRWLEKMVEGRDLRKTPAPRQLDALEALQQALGLKQLPMRVEVFDVSNIQGSDIVAAMVVFYGGLPLKSDYRKFKIKTVQDKPNDAAAMAEAINRRYFGQLSGRLAQPDLIVIDGGKGQVNAAAKALKSRQNIIGLAKREEEIFFPGRRQPLSLDRRSHALKLLQRLRDEAHRFAISFHRQRRGRALFG